jgi:nitroreductase
MFIDIARSRHSCRSFTDVPLTGEQVSLIMEAGDLAPSSRSLRPVRLVPIDDVDIIRSMAGCRAPGSTRALTSATFAVIVAVEPDVSDVWIEDASIASMMMQMEAEDLGLGSCWIQVRLRSNDDGPAEDHIRNVAGLPDGFIVESVIAFGNRA